MKGGGGGGNDYVTGWGLSAVLMGWFGSSCLCGQCVLAIYIDAVHGAKRLIFIMSRLFPTKSTTVEANLTGLIVVLKIFISRASFFFSHSSKHKKVHLQGAARIAKYCKMLPVPVVTAPSVNNFMDTLGQI